MSRIYLMLTNLRTLFLTVRSKFLPPFLVHSTPCVSTPVRVSLPHTPHFMQTLPFQLSPSHPHTFLSTPSFQHSGPLSLYSQYRKHCIFKAFPQKIWERTKHTCRKNLDAQDGNLLSCLHRNTKASAHCLLGALKNTSHPHVCLFSAQ